MHEYLQLAVVVAYLHKNNIIHRDVKARLLYLVFFYNVCAKHFAQEPSKPLALNSRWKI